MRSCSLHHPTRYRCHRQPKRGRTCATLWLWILETSGDAGGLECAVGLKPRTSGPSLSSVSLAPSPLLSLTAPQLVLGLEPHCAKGMWAAYASLEWVLQTERSVRRPTSWCGTQQRRRGSRRRASSQQATTAATSGGSCLSLQLSQVPRGCGAEAGGCQPSSQPANFQDPTRNWPQIQG